MKKLQIMFLAAAVLAGVQFGGFVMAAEHGGKPMTEHPGKTVSALEVKHAITAHVKTLSAANNGIFVIRDDMLGKEWRLKLDKVHDPVRQFEKDGQTIYFACSDFRAVDSPDILDIDFWMVKKGDGLEVIDSRIHKLNGKPRFTYEGTEIKELR
ncbi:MAG TPA: hypothetical protein VIU40_08710 [Geobacteraceae bacterium]